MFLSVVDGQTRSAFSGIRVGLGPSVRGPSSCQSKGPRSPHVRTEHPARPMEAVTSAHRDRNRSKNVRLPLSYGGRMLWHEAQRAIQSSLRMSPRLQLVRNEDLHGRRLTLANKQSLSKTQLAAALKDWSDSYAEGRVPDKSATR
jgi:hypothetical protein